jgi:phosphonate transport system substrate-binding protein
MIRQLRFIFLGCGLVLSISTMAQDTWTFGVVPQQSAQELAENWQPLFDEVAKLSGKKLLFRTAPTIPEFEARLAKGEYDFAYMNPYHFTLFSETAGYHALARARDKRIKGIIVVHKDHPAGTLEDLSIVNMAFPAPLAFAATILTQAHLNQANVEFKPSYVRTHDSVYLTVANGLFEAGGGVSRTFNNMPEETREQLRILWTSPGYTPHAVAFHESVREETYQAVVSALVGLNTSEAGEDVLKNLGLLGFVRAQFSDWDDVRALNIAQD